MVVRGLVAKWFRGVKGGGRQGQVDGESLRGLGKGILVLGFQLGFGWGIGRVNGLLGFGL